jgi:hypothetical protein
MYISRGITVGRPGRFGLGAGKGVVAINITDWVTPYRQYVSANYGPIYILNFDGQIAFPGTVFDYTNGKVVQGVMATDRYYQTITKSAIQLAMEISGSKPTADYVPINVSPTPIQTVTTAPTSGATTAHPNSGDLITGILNGIGSIFAPHPTATPTTTIVAPSGGIDIPAGVWWAAGVAVAAAIFQPWKWFMPKRAA